jgi:hypothetical protein
VFLRPVKSNLQHAKAEDRAFQPHRRERDPDLLEQLFLRQGRDLGRAAPEPSPSASTSPPARSRSRVLELHCERVAVFSPNETKIDTLSPQSGF